MNSVIDFTKKHPILLGLFVVIAADALLIITSLVQRAAAPLLREAADFSESTPMKS